jgi:hypothetical protein
MYNVTIPLELAQLAQAALIRDQNFEKAAELRDCINQSLIPQLEKNQEKTINPEDLQDSRVASFISYGDY